MSYTEQNPHWICEFYITSVICRSPENNNWYLWSTAHASDFIINVLLLLVIFKIYDRDYYYSQLKAWEFKTHPKFIPTKVGKPGVEWWKSRLRSALIARQLPLPWRLIEKIKTGAWRVHLVLNLILNLVTVITRC